jgi:hypothetical protein
MFHTLSYKGMPFFGVEDPDISLHFWIYTRFFEASILLTSSYFIQKTFNRHRMFLLFSIISLIIFTLSLYMEAPKLFVADLGLTNAKIYSEYVIIGLLLVTLFIWKIRITAIENQKKSLLIGALVLTVAAEFSFTQYADVYGISNQIGHLLKFLSFWLMYLAIIKSTLQNPMFAMTLAARSYDAIPFCVVVTNPEGDIKQANHSAIKKYPNLVEQNKNVHELLHDALVSRSDCKICQHIHKGHTLAAEVFAADERHWNLVSVDLVEQDALNPNCVHISIDITEQI